MACARLICWLAATLTSPLAAAQENRPATDRDAIIVTGRDSDDRRRAAHQFVGAVSPNPIDGQFARWHVPLCPAVLGLAPEIAERVARRLGDVARSIGAPVAAEPCRRNAFVVFTPEAQELRAAMERKQPRLLNDLSPAERKALRASKAPVLWWTGSHSEGADGNQFAALPSVAFGPLGTGAAIPSSERTRFGDNYRSSIVSTSMRVTIAGAVVLVDVPRSTGCRLDAVADFAAFVMLARVRTTAPKVDTPTILTLFSSGARLPDGLTGADRSYLRALYATPADRPARMQARTITTAVARGEEDN